MRALNQERGAVSVLVVGMVLALVGFAALAIDVSSLYQERRTLQNGADAGALAVAKDCAGAGCGAFTATADNYADLNADDGNSNVDEVCGTGPGLPACASPPALPAGTEYVKVTTSTYEVASPSNPTEVNFNFAPVLGLVAPGDYEGKTVRASAVAAWGSPGGATTLPLTFSLCEYQEFVPTPESLQTGPPFTGAELVVSFHGSAQAGVCSTTPSGQNLPGGFGWLAPDGECEVDITAGGWVENSTGVPAPSCVNLVGIRNTTVLLPIYDVDAGTGAGGQYHIVGFAAFYVTGYKFTGQDKWPNGISCPGTGDSGTCIKGYFTGFTTTGTSFGGPDMGVTIIKLVG